ncbi:MAG TPA: GerMN domain-containing protein [Acidimicrobiales bacterium]|nr:GerMN domain-containing protein [Acidimicrobiales bacterium]
MSRNRSTLVALCLVPICMAACGVPTQRVAHVAPDKDVPSGLLTTSTSTTPTVPSPNPLTAVTICLAQRVGPLKAVTREVGSPSTINEVLRELAIPPTAQEQGLGLETAVSPGISGTVKGGIAQISLNADFTAGSAADQLTAVGQIVCTLTAQPGIGQVQFEMSGTTIDVPRGDGSTTANPVSRDDYPQLVPPANP